MDPIRVVHQPDTPWRAYAVVAVIVLAGAFLSYQWVRQWGRVLPGQPATELNSHMAAKGDSRMQAAAAFKPLTDVQVVSDAEPRESLAGMPVQFDLVAVRGLAGTGGFWVSQVHTPAVFVAFAPGTPPTAVRFGDAVSVAGTVRQFPGIDEALSRWPGLRPDDLERLERQRVYIEAREVAVHGRF